MQPTDSGLTVRPLSSDQQQRLYDFLLKMEFEANRFFGFPCTRGFDYTPLYPFFKYPINDVGDPFVDSNFRLNTHQFEREVVQFFAELTRADQDKVWGYVTNGGTEGNMCGIYLARELFPRGMVYYSQATRYSVPKILRMLHARNIMIKSQDNGEIDYNGRITHSLRHRPGPKGTCRPNCLFH